MTWAVQRASLERRRESPETTAARAGRRSAHGPGPGEPLPDGIRDDLESRFGLGLGHVRVYREGAARGMVGEADRAQTTGSDIAFARGEWDPSTRDGRWLLAHELAHVIQQSRGGPASDPGASTGLEHAADDAADAVLTRSGPVQVAGAGSRGIQHAKKKKTRPQAQIGDLKRYSKQGKSIWSSGKRGSEHEHIRAKINLQLVTKSPAGAASPYGRSAYRRSVTLTIPRDMALLKTSKDLALRDRIKAGQASPAETHIDRDIVRTIEARDEAIAARKAGGQPTADLESLTDENIRWAAHLQQSELFDVGKKQVSPWAGMTDAEVQAATGIPPNELAHRLGGTGIDEFAGPTTTVDIPDHSTPKTLTAAQAAAEAAAFDKSPAVRAYRARKAAEAAQAALQPAATIEPGAAAQVDQPPAAPVNAEEAAAAPVKEPAVQVEQPPAAPVKTEEAASAPLKEPAVQVEQPPAAPVKAPAPQVDQPPAALKSAGPTGVPPIESVAAPKAVPGEITAPAATAQNTGRPVPEAEGSWKGTKVPESHSDPVGKASKVNAVLYAIRELRSRHDELVGRGADSKAAWLEAGGRASATLIANLRGGGTAAAVNAGNVYEQARKEGKDPLEAGATAVGTVAGGLATKQTAAGVAVEMVNNLAQLAGAPEGVQTATSGAVEALPSTAAVRVLTGGAQSFVAIGKGAYRAVKERSLEKGAKEIDKVVTGFAKGDVGPLIQSPALWVGIAADVASGDSFEKARDKAAELGSRDSQGNETWSSKAAGTVANLYLNLTHDPVERYDPVKEKQGKWERRLRRAFSW